MKYVRAGMICPFCKSKGVDLDYKNYGLLLSYVDYFGKIKKSYYKGICRKHQSMLALAVKRARGMGLICYVR